MIIVVTPFPPSVNHYYGIGRGGRKFIKPAGVVYRAAVLNYVTRYRIKAVSYTHLTLPTILRV